MPLRSYGVLTARAKARVREGAGNSPHYHLALVDERGVEYGCAVNVKSQEPPSELLYRIVEPFDHPILESVAARPSGWTRLPPGPASGALDFIRGNLFDAGGMRPLAHDMAGPDNDLADLLDLHVLRAVESPDARIHAFGEPWPVQGQGPASVGGVHAVHMNQGNSAQFVDDDGVWQDGALLIHHPNDDAWVGVFLAFQSQAWHTDDTTGHALRAGQSIGPRPGEIGGPLRIVAATVNPTGPVPERETVTVVNTLSESVQLAGWSIADREKARHRLPELSVAAGEAVRLEVKPPAQLGNNGGLITLLDPDGLKVDGVAYTRQDAAKDGRTIVF